jgi:hypothetical protein
MRATQFGSAQTEIVIARRACVGATHLGNQRKNGSPGSREEARPGDDELFYEWEKTAPGWPAFAGHDIAFFR